MNKVILMGRLTRDPEVRIAQDGTQVVHYTLAVDRSYRAQDGSTTTDFIDITAFQRRGDFARNYFRKGMRVLVTGSLHINSYVDKRTGEKRRGYEVVADDQEFCESKSASAGREQAGGNYNGGHSGGYNTDHSSNRSADFAPASPNGSYAGNGGYGGGYGNQNTQGGFVPAPDAMPDYAAPDAGQSQGMDAGAQSAPEGFTPVDTTLQGDKDLPF